MSQHEKINYIEFPARDLAATKSFFIKVLGWSFEDYGPEYAAFSNSGIDGGFFQSEMIASTESGSALVVLYSSDLESTLEKIEAAGGTLLREIFEFPGGRRFHFADPNGNEFAVWSEIGS